MAPSEWAYDMVPKIAARRPHAKAEPSLVYANGIIDIIEEQERIEVAGIVKQDPAKEEAGAKYLTDISGFLLATLEHRQPTPEERTAFRQGVLQVTMPREESNG